MKLCSKCSQLIGITVEDNDIDEQACCFVCLGFFQHENRFFDRLKQAIHQSASLYGGTSSNRISLDQSRIVLPGDIVHRYKLAESHYTERNAAMTVRNFGEYLKKYATERLNECLKALPQKSMMEMKIEYPKNVMDGEQGYLGVHILVTLAKDVPRPFDLFSMHRIRPSRRRPFEVSQGGDPKVNHEERLEHETDFKIWTINQAVASLNRSSQVDSQLLEYCLQPGTEFFFNLDTNVTVWRKPFYLGGKYTKSRTDVSQTPFFVMERGKKRRLGVTSVEEQILPVIERNAGGVSKLNEHPIHKHIVFGMIKFHASGREDIDVRMLLPDKIPKGKTICGRPFVCEVTDAFRLPSLSDLCKIVDETNHYLLLDEGDFRNYDNELVMKRTYGCNPKGVDISKDLQFVPASAYQNLQAETEEKIKHYACYCWSEDPFSSLKAIQEKLSKQSFPLEIQQKTPIRVMHRRVNMTRVRHVLTCRAERIDDHNFCLHISTDAGTYVKEWCHGDLGRTQPNLSTILGCKTDILRLDCEGIEL
jgi:tRNA pseudouridine synthase 10